MVRATKQQPPTQSTPPRVLIVDDDPEFVDLLAVWLERAHYHVSTVHSGSDALRALGCPSHVGASAPVPAVASRKPSFDLVVLDVSMPDITGTEVCRRLRVWPPTSKIPVLALTALTSLQNRLDTLKAGANDYLTKPFQGIELLARVGNLVSWYRAEKEAKAASDALFHQMQRHSQKLDGLNRMMGLMLAKRDVPGVLSVVVEGLVDHWDVALACVWLVDAVNAGPSLVLSASAGLVSRMDSSYERIPLDGSSRIARLAAQEQELLEEGLQDQIQLLDGHPLRIVGMRSFAGFPLLYKGRLTGFLSLFSRDRLQPSDCDMLRTFAHQATAAIENAAMVTQLTALAQELERSQAHLIQSEKMAAAGRLAASLAHEINNPLQAVHNCLALAQRFSLEQEEHREFLSLAEEEVQRLIGLVHRILEFYRPSRSHRVLADVNTLIEQVVALTKTRLEHSEIMLDLDLAADVAPVHVVPDQIAQVIMNLMVYGIETLPDGGRIQLSSGATDQWVEITLQDDGPGLSPSELEHLFEPFFTDKPAGTGLGLAISFGIVERHSGTIQVTSEDGGGTAFKVRLPVAEQQGSHTT